VNTDNIPTKRAYHHGNLKASLVGAALKELAKAGLEGFSLRSVAARAGVSPPAVHRHYADKDALLAAVAAECADRLATAMVAAVRDAPAHPLERFRSVGIALVLFAVEHPEHFRVLSLPGLAERATPEQRAREAAWNAEQRAALVDAQRRGLIANVPLEDLMLTANSAVLGLAHAIIEGKLGDVDAKRATELAIAVTGVLGYGFLPRDAAPSDPRRDC
jgi:AcrR family transcriptional regulator